MQTEVVITDRMHTAVDIIDRLKAAVNIHPDCRLQLI
jgi:hypothetical protein